MDEEEDLFKLLDENRIVDAVERLKGSPMEKLEQLLLEARMVDRIVQGKLRFLRERIGIRLSSNDQKSVDRI